MIRRGLAIRTCWVAWPAVDDVVRDGLTDDLLACPQHLENGHARTGAEVVCSSHARLERLDGPLVRLGQVSSVNVVTHAGAVSSGIITAIDQ